MQTAEQILELLAPPIRETYNKLGFCAPSVHFTREDGSRHLFCLPNGLDKDEWALFMRFTLFIEQAVSCVFINEGWTLEKHKDQLAPGELEKLRTSPNFSHDDPDCQEVVLLMAEDANGSVTGIMPIIRPADGKPYLGDLRIEGRFGTIEGRFVGLLPPTAKVN
jgi:hypothetical protein